MKISIPQLAKYFDHTCLKQDMTQENLENLIKEALEYSFFSVCIPPAYLKEAQPLLRNSTVKIATVIGFPLGYSTLETKLFEGNNALELGADELDLVASTFLLKNQDYQGYQKEISLLKKLCLNNILKVIIETSLLSSSEISLAAKLAFEAGADFVKTSTGFGSRGASLEDIALIRKGAPTTLIKASGGIKTLEDALRFINAGVQRIGSSSSAQILDAYKKLF